MSKKSKKKDAASNAPKASESVEEKITIEVAPEECGEEVAAAAESSEAASETPVEPEPEFDPQYLRLRADFDNFRRRTQREKAEWSRQAQENLINELLTILDHYELGLENARQHEAQEAVLDGFKLVYDQLLASLGKFGLKAIDTEGTKFDPNFHEAITHMPSPDVEAEHIMAQTRRGYLLGERLLRAAQVVVSRGAPEGGSDDPVASEG